MLKIIGHKDRQERLLKSMALLIVVCYLMSPLSQQMYQVLHTISHTLSPPEQIIGHTTGNTTADNVHSAGDHVLVQVNHQHEVIDFVKAFFDDTEKQSQNALIPAHKVDKHLTSYTYVIKEQSLHLARERIFNYIPKLLEGHTYFWAEPPKA